FCAFCRARAQILGERLGEPRAGGDEEGERLAEPRASDDREVAAGLSEEVMPVELYGVKP
ncbi:MAG: hypothetical protein ACRDHC_07470, partial [Actinomycetota bacterium]